MKTIERAAPWCAVTAAGFGIWFAAMAAMAALPQGEGVGLRVQVPTGVTVVYQDPKSLQTVVLRETRDARPL